MTMQEYTSHAEMVAAHRDRQKRLWTKPKPKQIELPEPISATWRVPFVPCAVAKGKYVVRISVMFSARASSQLRIFPMRSIIDTVSHYFQVSTVDIISQRRTANVVRPRQIICYLARHLTTLSLPQIGQRLGGRDHTTCLHAVRKVTDLRASNPKFDDELSRIERLLTTGSAA